MQTPNQHRWIKLRNLIFKIGLQSGDHMGLQRRHHMNMNNPILIQKYWVIDRCNYTQL